MDDATLEKLSIGPGKITPKFHRDVTEYSVVVGSNVKELKVNPLTSDSNASYSISGSGGGKSVPLTEGQITVITVEVTAEDGTIKNYCINATRLSSNNASLSNIVLSSGTLSPPFDPKCTHYTVTVPYNVSELEVKPSVADKASTIVICDHAEEKSISLNYGETTISIEVTSPDKTTSETYKILVLRKKLLWPMCFVDNTNKDKYSCPVCLGVLYCPKSIAESKPKHVFCKSCIDELTRTTKRDPLNEVPLSGQWQVDEQMLEQELSLVMVLCVYVRYGCQEKLTLKELGAHMKQCEYRLSFVDKSEELSVNKDLESKMKNLSLSSCPDCNRSVRPSEVPIHKAHLCSAKLSEDSSIAKVTTRAWEKKLQQETSEKSMEKMVENAEEQEQLYFKSLQLYGQSRHCSSDSSPITYLKLTSEWYATAIKLSPKDANLHFKLGQIFEELHFVQDCFGFKEEDDDETSAIDFNQKSRDSSKEDDIQAICEQRGVGRNAPLALQLKAIDEEYHYLLDSQQSDRCEYVQKLYAWKSKQATQDSKLAQQASDEEGSFGKAFVKYSDAVSHCPDNYLYHLHVGRFLLLQGKPEEAVKRLQIALGLKPVNIESRLYLGLALLQQSSNERENEAIEYLHEGLQHLLYKLTIAAESSDDLQQSSNNLYSNELLKVTNVQCLKGFILLGTVLARSSTTPPSHFLKPDSIFRCVATMAVDALCSIANKGELYHQMEWALLEAHSNLLQLLLEAQKKNGEVSGEVVARYCENLSSLLKVSSLPKDSALLQLQEKTCQQGVLLQPNNSRALCLLGNAQLSHYDNELNNNTSKECLEEAEQSFRVSLELEGKPSGGSVLPDVIRHQRWWKERQTAPKTTPSSSSKTTNTTKTTQRVSPTKGTTTTKGRGRGTTPAKTAAPVKGATRQPASKTPTSTQGAGTTKTATTRKNSTPKATSNTVTPKASTTRTGLATPSKQSTTAKQTTTKPAPASSSKTTGKTLPRSCSHTGETSKKESLVPSVEDAVPTTSGPTGPLNVPSYHARLGLARVLARGRSNLEEAQTFYHEVIKMAPDVHDAYIELGDMLVKLDPLGAVEVYSKYPFPDPLTYDDAYLHGEIVRHLVKHEKFEDERLSTSMVALGRVMGLSVLEKYVEIIDSKLKYSKLLMKIYAGVHGKSIDDPDLQAFFKFKCWL